VPVDARIFTLAFQRMSWQPGGALFQIIDFIFEKMSQG
jgi:hypothetical protein